MKQYLAIMKRDYGASGATTFWLPTPIFSVLCACLLTWWMASTGMEIKGWYFFGLTLLCAYRILSDLDLSHAHNLGFLAPDYKVYQFNYSTSLVFISSIITCVIFSDSFYEFLVCSCLLWLFISLMFFFVKKEIWQLAWVIVCATNAIVLIFSISFGQTESIYTFFPKTYTNVWSVLSIPSIGLTASCIGLAISYKSFLIAKSNYLKPKEYNAGLAPIRWKQHRKNSNFNVFQLFTNAKWMSKTWGKLESRTLFGLDIGRHEDLLYRGLFGARAHSALLIFLSGFIFIILLLPTFFTTDVNQEAVLIPICIFMLFYLIVVSSVISLEWINNRNSISELWLWNASKNRPRYMFKLAMLFAERIARVSFLSCFAFLLLATLISGVKGLMVVGIVALGGVTLSLLLQMTYVLLVTLKVKHIGWLRYITALFTGINFAGWLSAVFFSIQQKNYWILITVIGVALVICIASIKYWCRYDKELAT
ncbi:MAG: hypothetical protein ACJAS1_007420 [Oleiphilaceae bacterium]|jgi:hypothetical protein